MIASVGTPDQPEPAPQLESQLMKRFGATVLRDGFTCLPNVLLLHLGKLKLTRTEFTIIAEIWQCWWRDWPFPKVKTIASRMGVSRRAVQLQLARLKVSHVVEELVTGEDGEIGVVARVVRPAYVVVTSRFDDRGQTSNSYDFTPLLLALETLVEGTDVKADSRGRDDDSRMRESYSQAGANQAAYVIEEDESDSDDDEDSSNLDSSEGRSAVDNSSPSPHDAQGVTPPTRVRSPTTHPTHTREPEQNRKREKRTPRAGEKAREQTSRQAKELALRQATRDAAGRPASPPAPPPVPPAMASAHATLYGFPRDVGVETYVTDLTCEWHDKEHLPQNLSQALRLCYELGAAPQFYEMIGLARKKTNKAHVRSLKHNGRVNRMPYFFTVLRQQVEAQIACEIGDGARSPDWVREWYPEGGPA